MVKNEEFDKMTDEELLTTPMYSWNDIQELTKEDIKIKLGWIYNRIKFIDYPNEALKFVNELKAMFQKE